jgi:hypothetical protein
MAMETVPRDVGPSSLAFAANGIAAKAETRIACLGIMNLFKVASRSKRHCFYPPRFAPFKYCSDVDQMNRRERSFWRR